MVQGFADSGTLFEWVYKLIKRNFLGSLDYRGNFVLSD
ncbi:hypothetical protein GXM_10146 [Nostoc sphaeroides CCNUC1]|uniref:Uncharacterized protein n=1 Tax=Nostoc sphaeroides CCNUC1 TaxID=2653204 RepID=A0A5P8WKA6_9NOSO|nr:hypothetical protein GXM_10146 [Nostoc sphaeroides CCNUC1]